MGAEPAKLKKEFKISLHIVPIPILFCVFVRVLFFHKEMNITYPLCDVKLLLFIIVEVTSLHHGMNFISVQSGTITYQLKRFTKIY